MWLFHFLPAKQNVLTDRSLGFTTVPPREPNWGIREPHNKNTDQVPSNFFCTFAKAHIHFQLWQPWKTHWKGSENWFCLTFGLISRNRHGFLKLRALILLGKHEWLLKKGEKKTLARIKNPSQRNDASFSTYACLREGSSWANELWVSKDLTITYMGWSIKGSPQRWR